MLALNICWCRYGSLLNFTSKTTALRIARKFSDDATKLDDKIKKKKEKKKAKNLIKPYTNVANNIDETQTKTKLKELLNNFNVATQNFGSDGNQNIEVTKAKERKHTKMSKKKNKFDDKIIDSAKHVAKDLGGDVKKTENEIISVLKKFSIFEEKTEKIENANVSMPTTDSSDQKESTVKVHDLLLQSKIELKCSSIPESERLGIFEVHNPEELNNVQLKLWDKLEEEELKFLVKSPPRNYYEEMIHWTEEGKLWHFPIDNEQGMDEEAKYSFTDHVFLEDHLEPWCPKSGPLRHFMELVLVGLSKNPFLTVKQKHEHIYWFRDYFEQKRKLLMEVGAFAPKTISSE